MIYLDNSSTTREYDEVRSLVYEVSNNTFGNASSLHELGFDASNYIEEAREAIERNLSGDGRIIFTSGGTESDNMAIISACLKNKKRANKIITSRLEHPAVLNTVNRLKDFGFEIIYLDNDENGCVLTESLEAYLDRDVALVTIMTVNNEVGTIEPVLEFSDIIKNFNRDNGTNIIFHTDAVQAFGKIKLDNAGFDLISMSAHKIHGPKGVGALYMDSKLKLKPFITGGGQEYGYRSGTENVPGIAGFGLATTMSYEALEKKQKALKELNERLYNGIIDQIKDVKLNGSKEIGLRLEDYGLRAPNILSISFAGTRGEVLLHKLEQDGIFVSTGSACSSHDTGDSHVLTAMGLKHKDIEGTLRFSLSEFNIPMDVDFVVDKVKKAVWSFRRIGSFR